jgi:hypothetical protein
LIEARPRHSTIFSRESQLRLTKAAKKYMILLDIGKS